MTAALPLFAPPAATSTLLSPGSRISGTPFIVLSPMRHGGMGEVYEVVHRELDKRFALKCLHERLASRIDLVARMRFEARLLASIRHPNVVQAIDLGQLADGRPYFVMELLEGRDLRRELYHRGPLPAYVALTYVAQALDGLSAAHDAGALHRDIKLDNLFLEEDGTIKVIDFGVAKSVEASQRGEPRSDPSGTLRYMSPEQCSLGRMDQRADLYSAGMVLYELIAGRGPFDDLRGNRDELRLAQCTQTPPPLSKVAARAIDPSVEAAVQVALAKAPENRFQTAREMASCLRALAGERRRKPQSAEAIPCWWSEPIERAVAEEAPQSRYESAVARREPATTDLSGTIELSRIPTFDARDHARRGFGTQVGLG